jgi:hypothetical protein
MNQHTRFGPKPRPNHDYTTMSGASALANTIRLYWAERGKFPNVTVELHRAPGVEGSSALYCVRSNMKNGAPR